MPQELEPIDSTIIRGMRTPDGPMVVRYDPPAWEPTALRETNFDWGVSNRGAFELARFLLSTAGRSSLPGKGAREMTEEVVRYLDQRGFAITVKEVLEWIYGPKHPPGDNIDVLNDSGL